MIFTGIVVWAATYDYFRYGVQGELPQQEYVASEDWGGAVPMKVYQIYDRDTGVYYAVTEKGGICVMQTMSGEIKLVDEGDGAIRHPNQGE